MDAAFVLVNTAPAVGGLVGIAIFFVLFGVISFMIFNGVIIVLKTVRGQVPTDTTVEYTHQLMDDA